MALGVAKEVQGISRCKSNSIYQIGSLVEPFVAVFVLFALLFSLGCTVFWIWTIVDAAKTPDQTWVVAGQSKILWIVLIAVLGAVASLVYVLWPRPALRRAATAGDRS